MSKIVFVKTEQEVRIRTRHERRENARREKEGLPPKEQIIFEIQTNKIPKNKKRRPPKPPTPPEVSKVDSSNNIKDTVPTELPNVDQIAEQRNKAQERRKQLKIK